MNLQGLITGAIAFICIGIWHPIVIRCEYHLGKKKSRIIFFIIGALSAAASVMTDDAVISAGLAVFGFSAFWGIREAGQQEERVKKGWFPKKESRGSR